MKLTTVIELLQKDLDDPGSVDIIDLNKAQAIAIQALKARHEVWSLTKTLTPALLPGETADDDS